ncbi:MAG: hypothetical protein UY60_C0005G0027 [Parcubacteria group bacterium GW2011_GWB1_50_9]|nr:MAG: hypothetical protein UY60_C0005G0027 [Parcubacteria group bacterium GW2011_GWB1_50_9]
MKLQEKQQNKENMTLWEKESRFLSNGVLNGVEKFTTLWACKF